MSIEDLQKILSVTSSDVEKSIAKLCSASEEEFSFYARSYVRAYASWVEGTIWVYKQLIVGAEYQWHKELPIECQLFLFEHDWALKSSGVPYRRDKKIGTLDNIKGFFYVAGQIFPEFSVDFSCSGWQGVTSFYLARDKMMHPSGPSGLEMPKEELKKYDEGRVWLKEKFHTFGEEVIKKIGHA